MKIKRYQIGGIYYTPFFRDSVQQPVQPIPTKDTSEDKGDQLIQKEIISILKSNGLPSDVDYFLTNADSFLRKSQNLGSLWDAGPKSSYDMSDLIMLTSLANRVKSNSELHNDASKQIIDEGSGSEVAISNTGSLYVVEDNVIKTVALDTYHKNPDKYSVLTNSELIHLREEMPELAFNSGILTDLKNTVGMKSIVDYVKSTISTFGTNKSSNQLDRYTTKQKDQIEKGFEQLLGFDAPDGVYKVTESVSQSNQGQSLESAINYLYVTLPDNMRNVLRANAAAEGLNPNNPKDVQRLLEMAIREHTDHSIETKQSLDYETSMSKARGFGVDDSSPKEKLREMTRIEMMVAGAGGVAQDDVFINSSNSKSAIKIKAQPYGQPMTKDGNHIGMGTIRDIIKNDPLGSSIAAHSISFGDSILGEDEIDYVVYDGQSNYERAFLPIDKELYNSSGKVVPDLDALRRYEEFGKWLKEGYGIIPNSIVMKLQELNLDLIQDSETGEWVFRDSKPFFILNGYASDKALDINEESGWFSHIDSGEGSRIFEKYKTFVNHGAPVKRKETSRDNFKGSWFFGWGNADSMYKSMVFLPITDAAIATVTSNNELTSINNYVDMTNKRKVRDTLRDIKSNW